MGRVAVALLCIAGTAAALQKPRAAGRVRLCAKKGRLAKMEEDHRFEQFFWDDDTVDRLWRVARGYSKPLFLCCPSLGCRAESEGHDYVLLDRDTRFKFLKGYKRFSLQEPFILPNKAAYDAVFIDPPFANVEPADLAKCVHLMAPSPAQRSVPTFIAFPADRGAQLVEAFGGGDVPPLEMKPTNLGYRDTVSEETQSRIHIFGPRGVSV